MNPDESEQYADLPPAKRRRLMLRSLLRSATTVTLLVVLYYALPLDQEIDAAATMALVLGLLAFAGILAWQIRAITRSGHPRLRAIEALSLAVPVLVLLFATYYFLLARNQADSFGQPLSRTAALYFTVTVLATVGFGDITAKTDTARIVVTVQMLADLVAVGLAAKLVVGAVQIGVQRRSTGTAGPNPDGIDLPSDSAEGA